MKDNEPALLPLLPSEVGDTYPHRDALKKMGAVWSRQTRLWLVPRERHPEAVALVGPPKPHTPRPAPRRRTSADPAPPGWVPCGYPGCSHWLCDDCDGKGGGRWQR